MSMLAALSFLETIYTDSDQLATLSDCNWADTTKTCLQGL